MKASLSRGIFTWSCPPSAGCYQLNKVHQNKQKRDCKTSQNPEHYGQPILDLPYVKYFPKFLQRLKLCVIRFSRCGFDMLKCLQMNDAHKKRKGLKHNEAKLDHIYLNKRKKKLLFYKLFDIFYQNVTTCFSSKTTFLYCWHHLGHTDCLIILTNSQIAI